MPNPPALMVRRNFVRPADALVNQLRESPTGWVVDANGRRGALDYRVRPMTSAMRFCGVALTVQSRPRDNLAPYAAIRSRRSSSLFCSSVTNSNSAGIAARMIE